MLKLFFIITVVYMSFNKIRLKKLYIYAEKGNCVMQFPFLIDLDNLYFLNLTEWTF